MTEAREALKELVKNALIDVRDTEETEDIEIMRDIVVLDLDRLDELEELKKCTESGEFFNPAAWALFEQTQADLKAAKEQVAGLKAEVMAEVSRGAKAKEELGAKLNRERRKLELLLSKIAEISDGVITEAERFKINWHDWLNKQTEGEDVNKNCL
jgi:hypothetical protein